MNTQLLVSQPLPLLPESSDGRRRRYRVAQLDLRGRALYRFQWHAETMQAMAAPPSVDCIATTARYLGQQFAGFRRAPSIGLRLRCLTAVRSMAVEPHWPLPEAQRRLIVQLLAYEAEPGRLIPDQAPVIGGLDRALLVDMAWPRLRGEVEDYLDFRTMRAEEAALRGLSPHALRFSHEDWLETSNALKNAALRRRGQSLGSIRSQAPARFHVC